MDQSGSYYTLALAAMALSISRRGSTLANKRPGAIKWWCVHRAAALSVLALTVASTRATEKDASREIEATATSRLENARESNSNSNKPFFIQDPSDGLCLSGGTFKRCAVDTLWKVEGEAGRHSVRRLAVLEDGEREHIPSLVLLSPAWLFSPPLSFLPCLRRADPTQNSRGVVGVAFSLVKRQKKSGCC